jgi:ferritin-like metal-binding protein YciE
MGRAGFNADVSSALLNVIAQRAWKTRVPSRRQELPADSFVGHAWMRAFGVTARGNRSECNSRVSNQPCKRERAGTMGLFTKDIKSMDDLFVHTLRDMYYAEKQILKALPTMIEKATDTQLKQAFQAHLGETQNQVTRIEQVFKMHGVEAKGVDCPAIDGIIEESDEIAGNVDDKQVLNAALAAAAQAVEHYEISRYGTLIAWAKQLGRSDCASVLQKNLDEEKAADKKLTEIAEARLNLKAAS